MASVTVDHRLHHPDNGLHLESVPVLDLRLLSKPELLSLSLCSSSPSPSNAETELFTPKIDRSVFNESAGSRKQTFSRLRLAAPRNYLHHHHSSPSSKPFASLPRRLNPEPLDEESSRILPLLKSLFNVDDSLTANPNGNEPDEDKDLVPVQIEYPTGKSILQDIPVVVVSSSSTGRKRGRPRKDEKANWPIESAGASLVMEEQKDKAVFARVNETDNAGDISSCSEKRRRGRPRRVDSQNQVIESEEKKVESEIKKVELGNVEAILGIEEELRRKTEGMATEPELLEYLGGLEGEWASKSQKKRIVNADGFGKVLPEGWKLILFVKRRVDHVWLACSRYISPDGKRFVSCKDVSSYLLSFGGLKDSSQSTSSHTGCGIGSGVKPTSGNLPITCISAERKKKAPSLGTPVEVQRSETIKCHKCPMTFKQQDDFIGHLLASHQGTAKNSGHGTQTNEELVMKNGKYKCQVCSKLFEERNSYSNHLEIHIKNNTKNNDGSVGLIKQNSIQPFNLPSNNEIRPDIPCSGANENVMVGRDIDAYNHECNLSSHGKQDINVSRNEETLVDENNNKQKKSEIANKKGRVTEAAAVGVNVCLSSEEVLFTAKDNGISKSSERADVALNSVEVKKTEMASSTSLPAANAEQNIFSDENIEDRHFVSFMKRLETDFKDNFTGNDPKASCTNTPTRPDGVKIDVERQSCSDGCSLVLSNNEHGGNLVARAKQASATLDLAQEQGYRCPLTSYKGDQARVIPNKLTLASPGTLDYPVSTVLGQPGNNDPTIGFQTDHFIKKPPQQDNKSALLTLHGRDQNFFTSNSAFKVSSQRVSGSENVVEKSSGLIQDVESRGSRLDTNMLASVRHAKNNDYLLVSSPSKKTLTCSPKGRKHVKVSESSVYKQSANQQISCNETSMNKVPFSTLEERKHKVESSLNGNALAGVGSFDFTGIGVEGYSPLFSGSGERFAGKTNVPGIGSGTVHEPKQNKGSFEDFFCLPGSEQTQVTNNLNMIYAGTGQGESSFESTRNNEVMIGFGNHARRPEDSMTGLTWKSDEGSVLLGGLAGTSSQLLQSSGYYPTFDLMSNKAETEMFNISGKCSSGVSGFEDLRTDGMEHMEYNFLTSQPSSRSGDSKVCDSSIWFGKEALPLLPKVAGRHQVATLCSWCGNQFYNDAAGIGSERNSMAVMCGSCRARFSRNHDFL